MSREIEVSHWGQIWLEDTYELVHEGAKLKGGFSRLAYSRAAIDGIVPIIHMDIFVIDYFLCFHFHELFCLPIFRSI